MVPDVSLQGAVILWLQQPEQDACWVLWVKLPACGLHPTEPGRAPLKGILAVQG